MNDRIRELIKDCFIRDEYTEFGWRDCEKYMFYPEDIEKLEALIRDERNQYLNELAMRIALEREACAKLCEERGILHGGLFSSWAQDIAERIRQQGGK